MIDEASLSSYLIIYKLDGHNVQISLGHLDTTASRRWRQWGFLNHQKVSNYLSHFSVQSLDQEIILRPDRLVESQTSFDMRLQSLLPDWLSRTVPSQALEEA